jgi:predicted nucleic acid-binding protein
VDAFDADVLIYAATEDHPLGRRVAELFGPRPARNPEWVAGIGSTLLIAEILTKPVRDDRGDELDALAYFLARLDLRPVDQATAELAVVIGARYGLKPVDAIHLATALLAGADRFITNNRRDFRAAAIAEIAVTHPEDLPPPRGAGRLR